MGNSLLENQEDTSNNKGNASANGPADGNKIPPSYDSTTQYETEELNAAFVSLHLSEYPSDLPIADECLAHLKLLFVFRTLKEDVGYTDGLFGLWDTRCGKVDEKDRVKTLASIREKRWALYVARAVDRFQDWWTKVLCYNKSRLQWKEMLTDSAGFARFTEVQYRVNWEKKMLPPLGEYATYLLLYLN